MSLTFGGGKSVLGIDCSGLVQTVYSIAGFSLPRDASQQAQHGTLVESLSDAVIGDLAFFGDTKGKITHVGILKNNTEVIHASGWVKVDRIDEYGIISSITGEYTHKPANYQSYFFFRRMTTNSKQYPQLL